MICNANEIEHRLTKPNHPWTNGQVERVNRTIKEATVKRYHYDDHQQLRRHLDLFVNTYNHALRLKTLKGLTPAQFIWKQWQSNPELVLSRIRAAPNARLGHLTFEGQGAFSSQC